MNDILQIERHGESELTDTVESRLTSQAKRRFRTQLADSLADTSDQLSHSYGRTVTIEVETTDELKALQTTLDISEDRIREMQEEAGLQRLHPSRRKEFIDDILSARIEQDAEERLASEAAAISATAVEQIEALFEQEPEQVEISFRQGDSGSFVHYYDDDTPSDATVTIKDATADFSAVDAQLSSDVIVPEETTLHVDSPAGEQTMTLERGGYSITHRHLRELAEAAELIEREQREASCNGSDKHALDVEVGRGETDRAHVIELQSEDGGYSSRHTKGWTEYRDLNVDRQLVLITVGQASYYKSSIRGKSERTWLVGRDDGQIWAQQVYNSHETVDEAVDFMVPSEVQRLEADGRDVVRQGDFYLVEMIRSSNFDALEGTRHEVSQEGETVVVSHPEHDDLEFTGKWKAVQNNDGSGTTRSVARD